MEKGERGGTLAVGIPRIILGAETNFDKVGSNGLGAFGSCPIPDVNFLFIFFFF